MRHFTKKLLFNWHLLERDTAVFGAGLVLVLIFLFSFVFLSRQDVETVRDKRCLALNIYHEARGEPVEGQVAVATVAINRLQDTRYPDTLCDVIYQYTWNPALRTHIGQFSWTQDQISNRPEDRLAWDRAVKVADRVLDGEVDHSLVRVLHYHANSVRPGWSKKYTFVKKIGKHSFYRVKAGL